MTKVHPNAAAAAAAAAAERAPGPVRSFSLAYGKEEVLTVWKKSLLLNCKGYTVFDCKGNLVFRVDNYLAGHKGEIVLMDAAGKPLLTIRHKVSRRSSSLLSGCVSQMSSCSDHCRRTLNS